MHMALVAGIGYTEALGLEPGMIIDLYKQRQRYDDQMHGIVRRSACEREA